MKYPILVTLFFSVFYNCYGNDTPKQNITNASNDSLFISNKLNDSIKLSRNLTKVKIKCYMFPGYTDDLYLFTLSNKSLIIENLSDKKEGKRQITDSKILMDLIYYINEFYIDKKSKIVTAKTKRNFIQSTDYPFINVQGFKMDNEIFDKSVRIGDDSYHLEFNQHFIDFFVLLKNLISSDKKEFDRGIDKIQISGILQGDNKKQINFNLLLLADQMRGYNSLEKKIITSRNQDSLNQLIVYINDFYINNNKKIFIEEVVTAINHYENLQIKGFSNGEKILLTETYIKDRNLLNPEFRAFINFFTSLIK